MSGVSAAGASASRVTRPDRSRLFDVAAGQGGYFTAEQAAECGFSRALLAYHAKSGAFTRVRRGLYRFRQYPQSPREQVLASWLAVGKDTAVVSHGSAMDILGLSDVVPDAVHLTVPRSRRNLPSVSGVKIHTSSRILRPEDTVVRGGISVTSATRSILDAAEAGTSPEQIEMAVRQAVERGLTTAASLERGATERGKRIGSLISRALREPRMKYTTPNAFRTALERRLLTSATEDSIPLIRLRKLVVFDRLIARLMAVAPDRWVLKGAVALQFRAGPRYRTTKDVDFSRGGDEEAATADFLAAQSVDLGDYFSFAIERAGSIDVISEAAAVRYHARAELAGRPFEAFVVDVAFGDPVDGPDSVDLTSWGSRRSLLPKYSLCGWSSI